MPNERTVRRWALDDVEGFSPQYARAREIGYATHFDEILEIADTREVGETVTDKPTGREVRTGDMIEHRRLRIDARKWMLARALPKVYGDRLAAELTGKDGAPLQPVTDIRELARDVAFIFAKGMQETDGKGD